MKNPAFPLAALLASAGLGLAQTIPARQVPAAAQAAFKARFPGVKTITWEKEGPAYEAGFKQHGQTMSALISAAGVVQETETAMPAASLPAAVRTTLARDYQAANVLEAATIVRAEGTTLYEAEIRQGGKKRDVLFTADGRLAPK